MFEEVSELMRAQTAGRRSARPRRRRDAPHPARPREPRHGREPPALRVRGRARPRRPPPARPHLPPGLVDLQAHPPQPRERRRHPRSPPVGVRPLRRRAGDRGRVRARPPPAVPRRRRGRVLRRRVPRGAEPPAGGERAGLGASATTLPLWSAWEARRTLGLPHRSPRSPSWRSAGPAAPAPGSPPPVGNIVHLDRWGHQPFRARPRFERDGHGIMDATRHRGR